MDFFGENTGLYFYSALFQGNMALLGVLAVFAVFKVQHISSLIGSIDDRIVQLYQSVLRLQGGLPADFPLGIADMATVYERLQSLRAEYQPPHKLSDQLLPPINVLLRDSALQQMYDSRMLLVGKREAVSRGFVPPFLLVVAATVVAGVTLLLAHGLHTECPCNEMLLFVLCLLYECVCIAWATAFVLKSARIRATIA